MAANPNNVISVNAASTNITTSAYVVLSASTPIPCTKILVVNTTTKIIKLAIGATGSEVDLIAAPSGYPVLIDIGLNIMPRGSQINLEALDASAPTGFVAVSLIP